MNTSQTAHASDNHQPASNTADNHAGILADAQPRGAGPVLCDDGLLRTPWATTSGMLRDYYDSEWGMPVHEESALFERLVLEGFQAGLSWSLILSKREAFRELFAGFDPDAVAAFDEARIDALAKNPAIIRNRRKIEATVRNAQAVIALREEGGLDAFLWSFQPEETPCPEVVEEVPTVSKESRAMSRTLKAKGFSFVGPKTCYALMEALGMVDTHLMGSYRRGCSGLWDA